MNDSKLSGALAGIDAANAADPTKEPVDGAERPAALVYSERMTRWLERIAPGASEELTGDCYVYVFLERAGSCDQLPD